MARVPLATGQGTDWWPLAVLGRESPGTESYPNGTFQETPPFPDAPGTEPSEATATIAFLPKSSIHRLHVAIPLEDES